MSIPGMIIAIVLFILEILGTLLPGLPGAPLIWLGMLVYGFLTQFEHLTFSFYTEQGFAVLTTMITDYAATAYGTKRYGGSQAAIWGGILGVLIGPFVLGPLGSIIGPFLGAFALELLRGRSTDQSLQAALGSLIGLLGGTILKFIIEAIMIVWFFWVLVHPFIRFTHTSRLGIM